jgi:putative flavoprotein involved in K+ transport
MTEVLVVGGGQAGLAMSEHLSAASIPHIICERDQIAARWRSQRWDSLVANGPAWHDRFPNLEFADIDPDDFAPAGHVADYFVEYAAKIAAPIRCGVEVISVRRAPGRTSFQAQTTEGWIEASHVVVATGPFQEPLIPAIAPDHRDLTQLHSSAYRNPAELPHGAVLVVGSGSSGVQIADELLRAGRRVYLSVGPHDRPPRRYRGRDFVWWLGVLGKWEAETPPQGAEHVTIAVSGARGGHSVDLRDFERRGMTLVGQTQRFDRGIARFSTDLAANIARGDASYLALLDEADAYISRMSLDLPEEPEAREIGALPRCAANPLRQLDLTAEGVGSIIWATGFKSDYSWLEADTFHADGRPRHRRGVSSEPGVYFLGLPWLSSRGSSFIWGVWHDARYIAGHIATQRSYMTYRRSGRGHDGTASTVALAGASR